MNRIDRIKLDLTRNWKLPGKERLANLLKPSVKLKTKLLDGIVWLTTEDIAIYTSANNYIENTIQSLGTYEDEINKLIRISLKSGSNALDIGGNIGLQSIRMSQAAGHTGKIFAFEPLEYLQVKFKKNMSLNRVTNVCLFPYALSDKENEVSYKINSKSWNQGTFSLDHNDETGDFQMVHIRMGDNIVDIQDLSTIDLIKIDVEGFEYNVIRGLTKTICKHLPRLIFEYDAAYWQNNHQSILDCFNFLTSLSYQIFQITSAGCFLMKQPDEIVGGNLFCAVN